MEIERRFYSWIQWPTEVTFSKQTLQKWGVFSAEWVNLLYSHHVSFILMMILSMPFNPSSNFPCVKKKNKAPQKRRKTRGEDVGEHWGGRGMVDKVFLNSEIQTGWTKYTFRETIQSPVNDHTSAKAEGGFGVSALQNTVPYGFWAVGLF